MGNSTGDVRIVLADDHTLVREGIRSLLDDTDGVMVVLGVIRMAARCWIKATLSSSDLCF